MDGDGECFGAKKRKEARRRGAGQGERCRSCVKGGVREREVGREKEQKKGEKR